MLDNECESGNCFNSICTSALNLEAKTGQTCSSNSQCESNKCSSGTCVAQSSCKVLGGKSGPFDKDTIVIVFVGSGFSNMEELEKVANDNFEGHSAVEMFRDDEAKYKALYVREGTDSFCDYFCKGIERLLCCDVDTAKDLSSKCFPATPKTTQTVVIHNDVKYGGAGYNDKNLAVVSTHSLASKLVIHELGHSLFDFGDEYSYSNATNISHANCDVVGCPKVCPFFSVANHTFLFILSHLTTYILYLTLYSGQILTKH